MPDTVEAEAVGAGAARDLGYVVIEGPIGVGKTTLARRLARTLAAELILEAPQDNPFLARFYENQRPQALATQLFFLLQRTRQLAHLGQGDLFAGTQVADFFMDKDRLFAELTLDADELALYDAVHQGVAAPLPAPDRVVYLQAPVRVLRERIARRGIGYEQHMDSRYLEQLVEAYGRYFYDYDAAPLLIVDAAEIDLAHGEEDYNRLVRRLKTLDKGRHYFNPQPF